VSKVEVESTASLASARREAEGFTQRVAILVGELVDACQARDTTQAIIQDLSDKAPNIDRQQEEAERKCRELVQELTLLQTRGSELC
jgi:chromosome segregation ATPase